MRQRQFSTLRIQIAKLTLLLLSIALPVNSHAESPAGLFLEDIPVHSNLQIAELNSQNKSPTLSDETKLRIENEVRSLEEDLVALNDALIGAVKRQRVLESKLQKAEVQLVDLEERISFIRESLKKRRWVLTEVLVALQRMGKHPPPALIVKPQDALGAVRSAILLNAVLPEIGNEVDLLLAELTELENLNNMIEKDWKQFHADQQKIFEENALIESMITAKHNKIVRNEIILSENSKRNEKLAEESISLQDLVANIDSDGEFLDAGQDDRNSEDNGSLEFNPASDADPFSDSSRISPAIAFSNAQGFLPYPATGEVVRKFGETDENGGKSSGQILSTSQNALVVSPCDGWVEFAGEFKGYGNLLILDAGNGYYVMLAGMNKIDVQLGQFVLMGEPIGRMGTGANSETTGSVFREWDHPVLYIEFRKDDSPIDPNPWWGVINSKKVRG